MLFRSTDAILTHAEVAAERGAKVNGSDVTPPRVGNIYFPYSPARGDTYELGETIEVVVEFNRAVTVTGKPQLALTIGAETRHAAMSGWGRDSLYFNYTVQQGDHDEDGITIPANSLVLTGATTTAADGTTDADLTHGTVAAGRGSKVNGSLTTPPAVSQIYFLSFPGRDGTYSLSETIEVLVEFDRAVTATGTPQVALTIGPETRHAVYSESWDDRHMHFSYAVQEDDRDEEGMSITANSLRLNGGTIKLAADRTVDADLTHGAVAAEPLSK